MRTQAPLCKCLRNVLSASLILYSALLAHSATIGGNDVESLKELYSIGFASLRVSACVGAKSTNECCQILNAAESGYTTVEHQDRPDVNIVSVNAARISASSMVFKCLQLAISKMGSAAVVQPILTGPYIVTCPSGYYAEIQTMVINKASYINQANIDEPIEIRMGYCVEVESSRRMIVTGGKHGCLDVPKIRSLKENYLHAWFTDIITDELPQVTTDAEIRFKSSQMVLEKVQGRASISFGPIMRLDGEILEVCIESVKGVDTTLHVRLGAVDDGMDDLRRYFEE